MYPYIGITDFTDFGQVESMLRIFTVNQPQGFRRKLHVGVMMSYKTLHGLQSRWQDVFPPKEKIADIFSSGQTYNCLHYADHLSKGDFRAISEAIAYGGIGIDALQLDMTWPDPGQIANGAHVSRKQIEVILQIGKNAFEDADNNPQAVVERIGDYEGVIHRVLLDKSMGRGVGMDADGLIPFATAIRRSFSNLGIGVAGGLGPDTINLVKPLIREFPNLSIDAQGRLRPSGSALDPIDWNMAGTYLVKAIGLFS